MASSDSVSKWSFPRNVDFPTLTTVRIPDGVDGKAFSQHLLNTHGIEVGGGLVPSLARSGASV